MELFKLIMALVGVLALVFGVFWLMKKLTNRVAVSDSRHLKILERVNLGPDKMLLLVSVCGKCMVLAVTANHTEKICDLEETEEDFLPKKGENPTFSESFKTVMGNMLGKKK